MRVPWKCRDRPSIPMALPSVPELVKSRQSLERTVESSSQRSLPWFANFAVRGGLERITASKGEQAAWNLGDQRHVTRSCTSLRSGIQSAIPWYYRHEDSRASLP